MTGPDRGASDHDPASAERPGVVLDTNVFVAAGFNPRSAAAKILDAVQDGALRLVWDDPTRAETERVLRQIPPLRDIDVSLLFRPTDRFDGRTHPERFGHVPDPEDRKFAALARAADAVLISNDGHLLGIGYREAPVVLTPGGFWQRVGG